MKKHGAILAAALLAAGALVGWLAAGDRLPLSFAQENQPAGANPEAAPEPNGTPLALPRPDFHYKGNVGRTILDSDPPQFPQPTQAPKGAPNVVLILLDDTGFGQYSTFGGG